MAVLVVDIVLLIINIANAILHILGCYLLLTLVLRKRATVQMIFILNLSISEAFGNMCAITTALPYFIQSLRFLSADTRRQMQLYMIIVFQYLVDINYYLSMYYITADRLISTAFCMKYPSLCTVRKAVILVVSTWLLGVSVTLTFALLYTYHSESSLVALFVSPDSSFILYAQQICSFLFVLFAVVSYSYIFHLYVKTQKRRATNSSVRSTLTIFLNSSFFIPILLVLTWIFFNFVPNGIGLYYFLMNKAMGYELETTCYVLHGLSDSFDGIFYIFLLQNVRQCLWEKIISCCVQQKDNYCCDEK